MTESTYNDTVSKISRLSNAELDQELEQAAILSEKSEMLVCCYLSAARERRAYEEFGYSSIYDYAQARFGFGPRKTRYLVSLGRKIDRLPKIREALASGKIGWCKASRVASVAAPDDEVMWLESALSLTVQQLEQRIKDGTDTLASVLHLPLTEERRLLWENALEIYRRRAGAEISPVEAFELMVAEVLAEWGHAGAGSETREDDDVAEEPPASDDEAPSPRDDQTAVGPMLPWAEVIHGEAVQASLLETERAAEAEFMQDPSYDAVRHQVLERDSWNCTYPGCGARATLQVHHIEYRSQGGSDAPRNLTVLCHFHHRLLHAKQIDVKGRAPHALEWTPPKLMRAVLERRRNHRSIWVGDLEVREWSLETNPERAPAVT